MPNIPKLLYAYLAREMLAPFFASFIIMNCVFFLVKFIPFLNFVLDLNISFGDFIRLFSYLFPNIFLYTIPMAAMLGVTIGFARLSSDTEILALKASGVSMYQIIPPVLLVTAIIALLTSYFSIKLIPLSEMAMKQLTYTLMKEKITKGIKPQTFTEALGDVVVYVDGIDKNTDQWDKVWVSDMRHVRLPTVTMATSGNMTSNINDMNVSINLNNGSLHRSEQMNAQIVEFKHYQINIPLNSPNSKATQTKQKNILGMSELLAAWRTAPVDNDHNLKEKRKLFIEFNKRLVLPAGCLLISLLGLPLGLQAKPGKKAVGIQAGLAIFVIYYILFSTGRSLAEEGTLPVIIAMWAPNTFFFLLTVFWIYRVAAEKSLVPMPVSNLYFALKQFEIHCMEEIRYRFFPHSDPESAKEAEKQRKLRKIRNRDLVSGNPKTKEFHYITCKHFLDDDCTLKFKDHKVARRSGFSPCPKCRELEKQKKTKS
ncbi:LPS export ABC transporter permease LptF [Desulforhopalus vacuolatus]|uniref:LPS export ABC transporter permease LptF n=1 Tax=Desulforhopalus vacuolatus TaxID=40414 RepID=UPI001966B695|nr:LPS export ABC transporter permease LptF [Desulforhopalus vacuolatus]MBM9519026.1 LPS export ABC transporter permease LptF [Desulforhopalus vacuolatus]